MNLSDMSDYHIHTPYCGHATGEIYEYVETAIELGLKEICFTDHLGRYYLTKSQKKRYWDWGMDLGAVEEYYNEISNIVNIYKNNIVIKTGLEIDYIEGAEDKLLPILSNFDFDYLIGSIHCIPMYGWRHVAKVSVSNPYPVYVEYFSQILNCANSGIFNSIGHLDFIWRYVTFPEGKIDYIMDILSNTMHEISKTNTSVEFNTNIIGFTIKHKNDNYNQLLDKFISKIKENNINIVIGSDAHSPSEVGRYFEETKTILLQNNIKEYNTYANRKLTNKNILLDNN